ncbi:hypothetical protein OI25_6118 [Paraburkholderia fungorum]|uniref:Uncharacterized protein n=1 Tax=Paraburkholderia fungorum TaxID=134537 RepID=A0AAU8TCA0_9BURK|nr:hypothetical protein OI25_6118 [Paraburkholderia fungorum]
MSEFTDYPGAIEYSAAIEQGFQLEHQVDFLRRPAQMEELLLDYTNAVLGGNTSGGGSHPLIEEPLQLLHCSSFSVRTRQ